MQSWRDFSCGWMTVSAISRQPAPWKSCSDVRTYFQPDIFLFFPQGLKPVVSKEAPPIIFATPTKLTSDYTAYDYAGKNKVPELQKFFQVREDSRTEKPVK